MKLISPDDPRLQPLVADDELVDLICDCLGWNPRGAYRIQANEVGRAVIAHLNANRGHANPEPVTAGEADDEWGFVEPWATHMPLSKALERGYAVSADDPRLQPIQVTDEDIAAIARRHPKSIGWMHDVLIRAVADSLVEQWNASRGHADPETTKVRIAPGKD